MNAKRKGFFTPKNAILFFVLFLVMYALINFKPFGLARLLEITNGHSILDMEMQGFTPDKAYAILEALGTEGRAYHLSTIMPLDFPFPAAYALFYFVTLTVLAKSLFPAWKRPWLIGIVGLLAGLFDWIENIFVFILIKNYPARMDDTAAFLSNITQIKAMMTLCSMALILTGLIVLVIKRLTKNKKKH